MKNILFVSVCLLSFHATAETMHPGLTDKWQFTLAAFNQKPEATVQSPAPGDTPIKIDLGDLGLDDSDVIAQLGARWRFKDKWALTFAYSDFGLSSRESISREFNYNGVTYPVEASLTTSLDLGIYIVALDYAFYQSDRTEWGIGAGLHALDLGMGFKASLNDVALESTGEDFLAPLPNIRLFGRYAFSPKLLGSASVGWLGLEVGDYDGSVLISVVSLDYRFSDRWSAGINYQYSDFELTVAGGANDSEYGVQIGGASLTLKYAIPK